MQSNSSHRVDNLKIDKIRKSRSASPKPKETISNSYNATRKSDVQKQSIKANADKYASNSNIVPVPMQTKEPTTIFNQQKYDKF